MTPRTDAPDAWLDPAPATAEALAAHGLELLRVPSPWETGDADPDAPVGDLVALATATAGRTVLISGLGVAAAMVGLYAFADPLLAAMALGGGLGEVLKQQKDVFAAFTQRRNAQGCDV